MDRLGECRRLLGGLRSYSAGLNCLFEAASSHEFPIGVTGHVACARNVRTLEADVKRLTEQGQTGPVRA
jgi:hypothetical protein